MSDGGTVSTPVVEFAVRMHGVSIARGGRTIWSDGDFDIPVGAVVGVIGPNGSGKSSLLKTVLGELPYAGDVAVLGRTPRSGDPRIGYVPQNYTASASQAITVRDLVSLGITGVRWGLRGLDTAERTRVDRALVAVSAEAFADRRMGKLSGGQQQRIAIAQALVHDPELLLLDEPLANLDVRSQIEIVDLLRQLNVDRGMTIIVVAHDLNPLLSALSGVVYLLDEHPHFGTLDAVVEEDLLSHLYGTSIRVVRTAQGDLFTRAG